MLILVSYDISDDRRRTKVASALEDFGTRVQWSVFECRLEEAQVARLRARLGRWIDATDDSVRIYRLCAECGRRIEILGRGVVTEDPAVYVL